MSTVEQASADVDAMSKELVRMPAYFRSQGVSFDDVMATAKRYGAEAVTAYHVRCAEEQADPNVILQAVAAAVWARGFAVGRQHRRLESLDDD